MKQNKPLAVAGALTAFLTAGTAWGQATGQRLELAQEENGGTQPQAVTAEERLEQMEQRMEELEQSMGDSAGPVVESSGGGVSVEWPDGNSFEFGGRIMIDYDLYDGIYNFGNDGDDGSEGEFRRTRLELEGTVGEDWLYVFVIDIDDQDSEASVNDGWIGYTGWGPTLSVGKFKEPFSLERLTSSKWITFDERSLLQDAIFAGQPDFAGIMLSGYNAGISWAGGVFDDGDEDGAGEDSYALTGRVAGAPTFGENHFLHLGAAVSDRNVDDDTGSYGVDSDLSVHTLSDTPVLFDGTPVDDLMQYGLEAAYVLGPFSVQGEYIDVSGDGADGNPDADVSGYYAQIAYTLTGEPRTYKPESAAFDKIEPAGAYGAWEIAARHAKLEGDVDGLDDPELEVLTLGLNWYANENVKFMLNYLMADSENAVFPVGDALTPIVGEDDGDAITLRAQYVW